MPNIDLINVPLYGPNDPYHYAFDNIPLKALIQREEIMNLAIDNVINDMRGAQGTQGSIANRLSKSLHDDGSLKTAAINASNHGIAHHVDDATYVRMLRSESDKLALIDDQATNFGIDVQLDELGDSIQSFREGSIQFVPSDLISWSLIAPNKVKADVNIPVNAVRQNHYDQTPVSDNLSSPDYQNYKVNSMGIPFISGTLRVYLNGIRLSQTASVYVPDSTMNVWTLISFTPDPANGKFTFSIPVSPTDIIRIDYDTSYT